MLKNYFLIAFRNLLRNKLFSIINIVGLSIGLTCAILILFWVEDEISYDKFHDDVSRIYRVVEMQKQNGEPFPVAVTPSALAPALVRDFPEVSSATRLMAGWNAKVEFGDNEVFQQQISLADQDFFEIFNFPLIQGEINSVFDDPYNVIISEEVAQKLFGDEDPMDKVLIIQGSINCTVKGVFSEIPRNSHLQFDLMAPFVVLKEFGWDINNWGSNSFYTYIKLVQGVSAPGFEHKIADLLEENDCGYPVKLMIQSLKDIHLKSDFTADFSGHGSILYVNVFFIVALLILGIACINFMNLSTAKASARTKEIGMRKVIGAKRKNLIFQFYGESFLTTILAMIIALILTELLLPYFNNLALKNMDINIILKGRSLIILLGVGFFAGLVAGSYPALLLSGFKPVDVLKGSGLNNIKGAGFRKTLVIIQFTMAIALVTSTLIIFKQLRYMRKVDLGFNRHQIINTTLRTRDLATYNSVKQELLKLPGVENVTTASQSPLEIVSSGYGIKWEGKDDESMLLVHTVGVGYDFFETFEMEFIDGRPFSAEFSADTTGYIVNEKLAELIGKEELVGKDISYYRDNPGSVIGIVKDFHFKSLHRKIELLIMWLDTSSTQNIFIKLAGKDMASTIKQIENIWAEFEPDYEFNYRFLDDQFDSMYRAENRMGKIFYFFTWLVIFISCIGLFGLSSYLTERRYKEIGIRKVMGSSINQIVKLLSFSFLKWVLIADLIALPITWFLMKTWLANFAYRIDIDLSDFIISGMIAILIAFFTVSFQTFKASMRNPVESLKYE